MLRSAPLALLTASTLASTLTVWPAQAQPTPVLIDCAGQGVVKPTSIQIGCATGSVLINDLSWSSWSMNEAKGRGTLVVNSCIYAGGPTCVEGKTTSYPAQISLGRQASGPGISAFSKVNLRFADGGPAALNSGSYILDRPIRP
ncbi:MAG: hypothetical protein RLZZ11_1656 [Cyanobacteriota bacterium]|jgi:hypothetical protein